MHFTMRLSKQRGIYYLEIQRNQRRSLGTRDEKIAKAILREAEKEALRGRLFDLEKAKRITLSEFKAEYISFREGLKDLSTETIKKDNLSLKLLADVNGGNTLLVSVDIEQFKSVCLARGASKITINGYLRHLKTSFKWAKKKTYLKKIPDIAMYKRLKKPEAELLSRILEPEEIKNFLRKAYKRDRDWGDYCLVTLWTGGRRRESLGIEYQKTDFKNERLTLTGKTGSRTVPMLRPVKIVLGHNKKDIGRAFPDWHPDTVSHWFQETAKEAGISKHRLHDLRHTCATYLLKNGVALEVVQRIMGHANISTTQLYAKVLDEILHAEMRKLKFK
jgi:site-specific recombinase XerD